MEQYESLERSLLSACGTCDFLSSLTGWSMRDKLADDLADYMTKLNTTLSPRVFLSSAFPAIFASLASVPSVSPSSLASSSLAAAAAGLQKKNYDEQSDLLDDFIWADDYFRVVSPDFPRLNESLIRSIYARLAALAHTDYADWMKHLFSRDEYDRAQKEIVRDPDYERLEGLLNGTIKPDTRPSRSVETASSAPASDSVLSETEQVVLEPSSPDQNQAGQDSEPTDVFDPALSSREESALDHDLHELDSLIGLDGVKREVRDLCALLQISRLRKARGLKTPPTARHLVFSGAPGTGKTTTARILAKIYKDLGFLSKGNFVECSRTDLVGEYIGSTAQKTAAVLKKAKGGVLFIDEAYSLARDSKRDFGQEAIEVLLQEMENNRDDLVVIVAGYEKEMDRFLSSNPGLRSRFTTFIHFDNYTPDQLMAILEQMARHLDYRLDEKAREKMHHEFERLCENPPEGFANARDVRTLLEKAMSRQAGRLMKAGDMEKADLETLLAEDFDDQH